MIVMKTSLKIVSLAVVMGLVGLALALGGLNWWTTWRFIESTNNAYVQADIIPIIPKVSGYVRSIEVDDNQPVAKGAILLRIDDQEYIRLIEGKEAEIEQTAVDLLTLDQRDILLTHLVDQAEAQTQMARTEWELAKDEAGRSQKLIKHGNTTDQKNKQVIAALNRAEAQMKNMAAKQAAAKAERDILTAEKKKLAAIKKKLVADLEILKLDLANTTISAPQAGIIGNRAVQVGQLVDPGRYLMAVVPTDKVWVIANFKETQLTNMQAGQSVKVKIDAYPEIQIKGKIDSISPASGAEFSILPPQNATGNFTKIVQRIPVKISLNIPPELEGQLRPGMSSKISIQTKGKGEETSFLVRSR